MHAADMTVVGAIVAGAAGIVEAIKWGVGRRSSNGWKRSLQKDVSDLKVDMAAVKTDIKWIRQTMPGGGGTPGPR